MTERNIKDEMEKNNHSMSYNYIFEAIEDIYKEINEMRREIAKIKKR
jgi:hypothetical protein